MRKDLLLKISILSASLVVVSGGAIAANIPAMAKTFTDVPLQTGEMLSTIPSLFITAGFLFGKVYRITRTYTLPISFTVMSLGMFLIASSNSVLQTSIAAVICGFSFRTFLPYLFNKVSTSSAGNAAYRTSLILVGFNVGAAFSPYGIVVLERLFQITSVRGIFYIEAAILLGLAVFRLVMNLKKPRIEAQVAAAE